MEINNQGERITQEVKTGAQKKWVWMIVGLSVIIILVCALGALYIMFRIHNIQQDMGKGLLQIMNNQTCEKENVTVCKKIITTYVGNRQSEINVIKDVSCNETHDREISQEVCRA